MFDEFGKSIDAILVSLLQTIHMQELLLMLLH